VAAKVKAGGWPLLVQYTCTRRCRVQPVAPGWEERHGPGRGPAGGWKGMGAEKRNGVPTVTKCLLLPLCWDGVRTCPKPSHEKSSPPAAAGAAAAMAAVLVESRHGRGLHALCGGR